MRVVIAWWDLTGSDQTIESLREYLRDEGVEPWRSVRGMRLKLWVSDPATNRWGAVMFMDDTADPSAPMPPNRAADLIGFPPTLRMTTDVEAVVEGVVQGPVGHGLAFATSGAAL